MSPLTSVYLMSSYMGLLESSTCHPPAPLSVSHACSYVQGLNELSMNPYFPPGISSNVPNTLSHTFFSTCITFKLWQLNRCLQIDRVSPHLHRSVRGIERRCVRWVDTVWGAYGIVMSCTEQGKTLRYPKKDPILRGYVNSTMGGIYPG